MEYASKARLLGLPLIHFAIGGTKRGIARGWIAIGDIAYGVIFSCGGAAVGGIALGGAAFGILSFGGVAMGVWAMAGGAIAAYQASGGLAVSGYAAIGGAAISAVYAQGGEAIAPHANDVAANAYFADQWMSNLLNSLPRTDPNRSIFQLLFIAVCFVPFFVLNWLMRSRAKRNKMGEGT